MPLFHPAKLLRAPFLAPSLCLCQAKVRAPTLSKGKPLAQPPDTSPLCSQARAFASLPHQEVRQNLLLLVCWLLGVSGLAVGVPVIDMGSVLASPLMTHSFHPTPLHDTPTSCPCSAPINQLALGSNAKYRGKLRHA